ncbi:MAG: hypothetical protein WDW36_003881 [Sanguina aurantia]
MVEVLSTSSTFELDDIQGPKDEEDLRLIQALLHIDECFFCSVCVPNSATTLPKEGDPVQSQQRRAGRRTASTDTTTATASSDLSPSSSGTSAGGGDDVQPRAPEGSSQPVTGPSGGSGGSGSSYRNSSSGGSSAQPRSGEGRSLKASRDETETDGFYHLNGKTYDLHGIAPRRLRLQDEGAPAQLHRLPVRTNKTASGWAVVKTWCIPVLKVKQRGLAMCSPRKVYAQVKLLLAQQKLTAECGLQTIVPKLWVEPVNGIIPGKGFHINWLGLWADIADGVSVQNVQEFGKPQTSPEVLMDMLTHKVNHTAIKLGAIFDLLFSQCDRHQQNIFIRDDGNLQFIDNDQVFKTAWRACGIDSMIVPTTQKFMINHLGFFYVLKYPTDSPPDTWNKVVNPLLLLDYRCHVEGGEIQKNFPPALARCMSRLAAMAPLAIQDEFGYPALDMAEAVRNRSRDLLGRGYEWTLLHGEPTNQPMHRYKIPPKCCGVTYSHETRKYTCNVSTPWEPLLDLPYGNAWHGGKWHGPADKDTGSYVGGTVF